MLGMILSIMDDLHMIYTHEFFQSSIHIGFVQVIISGHFTTQQRKYLSLPIHQ